MQERRKLKREHLIHYLRVFNKANDELTGQLVDITPDGIMLICTQPVPMHANFEFRMDFPEEVAGKIQLTFHARCVWCKVDINPDMYAVGFELTNILREDVDIIEALIDAYRD